MRSNTESAPMVMSPSRPMGVDTLGSPVRAMTSPVLSTISRGSSGLPVAWAGQTLVQRPHMVQASVSSSCFQVKSSMVEAPKLSSSVSIRFGIGFMAPLGRSRSFRYMFSGDVNMCRSIVTDRIDRKTKNVATWTIHQTWCQPSRCEVFSIEVRERVADDRPLLERRPAHDGDAVGLGEEAGDPEAEEHGEDHRVLGLGLDADAVGPLDVAADDRPRPRRSGTSVPATSPTSE